MTPQYNPAIPVEVINLSLTCIYRLFEFFIENHALVIIFDVSNAHSILNNGDLCLVLHRNLALSLMCQAHLPNRKIAQMRRVFFEELQAILATTFITNNWAL